MKKRIIGGILALLIIIPVVYYIIPPEKNRIITRWDDTSVNYSPRKAHFVTNIGGDQKILVIPYLGSDTGFKFYRDINNDGWADSVGEGFYMFDLSRRISEETLPSQKYHMDSLFAKYQ